MEKRQIIRRDYYKIPLCEKLIIFVRRLLFLPYYFLRYSLRRFIKTDYTCLADVFKMYFRDYELQKVINILGINERDTTAAVKVLTYMHTLTGVIGEITEMTPKRSVRVESHCPSAKLFSQKFCEETLSVPSFSEISKAINPNIVHTHETFLSGGDCSCKLVFELKEK